MFDGLFKPKFYSKCKALVSLTKTRIETVKRKKTSVCKYLKNDIVDLLKNNLDSNAYGRAEGLIVEKRRLSCYESLEQFCTCVSSNVSLLQKSSGCPDECREAISSLVYAAARVSEVPELRDLRSLFTERYGNSLEQFVNLEFVERFKVKPPSPQIKVELLQEIAKEYSIQWDAKNLEQRLYPPPSPPHDVHHHDHDHVADLSPSFTEEAIRPKKTNNEEIENRSNLNSFHNRKDESLDDKNNSISCVEDTETKPFYYRFMPAPYNNKPKIEKQESLPEKITTISEFMAHDTDSPKPKPRSVRRRFANPPPDAEDKVEYPLNQSSKNMRSDSMEKAGGEVIRRMNRRTASWQPRTSSIPDFDEVAARVDELTRN